MNACMEGNFDKRVFLESLIDKKILDIIRFLIKNQEQEFYLKEIAEGSKVPIATTFRIVNKLYALKIVEQVQLKSVKLYKMAQNTQKEFLCQLIDFKKSPVEEFARSASRVPGVQSIILHTKSGSDKPSMLIIGTNIDKESIRSIADVIQRHHQFGVSYLTLDEPQFAQMSQMGLFSGKKEVLFSKS